MIQTNTKLNINDNSGVKQANCIKILNKSKSKSYGKIGDFIVISVKKSKINLKAKKIKIINKGLNKLPGDSESRVRGLISWTKYPFKRWGGYSIKSYDNSIMILDRANLPWSTRIYGPVFKELNKPSIKKLYSLARYYL